jgi:hypothetical protein
MKRKLLGPMLWFQKIFSAKKWQNIGVFVHNTAGFSKILIITLVFKKNAIFLPKIGENCDQYIHPRSDLTTTNSGSHNFITDSTFIKYLNKWEKHLFAHICSTYGYTRYKVLGSRCGFQISTRRLKTRICTKTVLSTMLECRSFNCPFESCWKKISNLRKCQNVERQNAFAQKMSNKWIIDASCRSDGHFISSTICYFDSS